MKWLQTNSIPWWPGVPSGNHIRLSEKKIRVQTPSVYKGLWVPLVGRVGFRGKVLQVK